MKINFTFDNITQLEEVHITMEEEGEDYNPDFDAASYT